MKECWPTIAFYPFCLLFFHTNRRSTTQIDLETIFNSIYTARKPIHLEENALSILHNVREYRWVNKCIIGTMIRRWNNKQYSRIQVRTFCFHDKGTLFCLNKQFKCMAIIFFFNVYLHFSFPFHNHFFIMIYD